MRLIYQNIINFLIRKNYRYLNKIFFNLFKFFIKEKIILDFIDYKFYAYPQKKDLSRWMLRNLEIWDKSIINLILNEINNINTIFIDIGCNYGAYAIPIAKLRKDITVYCFDPSKKSLNKLHENINLNKLKNIFYFKIGIGDKKRKVFFDDKLINQKNSGSYHINNKKIGASIEIDSIDNLIEQKVIIPKKNIIIKMDIEGYEFFALKGLKTTIMNNNVVIFFEFSKRIIENHNDFKTELKNYVKENSLKICDLNFEEKKIDDLFKDLSKLSSEHEVLDNFILMNK